MDIILKVRRMTAGTAVMHALACTVLVSVVLLTSMAVIGTATADTLTVGSSGCDYTTIQAAVDAAAEGDTIFVWNGSYTENVDVDKRLTLRGEGANVVTVTTANSDDNVFEVTADHVNISGFTATGRGYGKAGIYLGSADNCNIYENNCSNNYYGTHLSSSSNNTLASNTASNNYYGTYIDYSSNNILAGNTASSNNMIGICLYYSSNNTLTKSTTSNNRYGIYLYYSSNNLLKGSTASSNKDYGIRLSSSSNNTLANNTMSGNAYNFGVYGYSLSECTQNIDTSNTVDGKPIYYWVDQKDRQIPSDAGFVGIVNGTNITVIDLTLTNNSQGVLFAYTENSRIDNVTASSNVGIFLYFSSSNTILNNTASSNSCYGIFLHFSSSNTILNNTASSNNGIGIVLVESSSNTLANNTMNSNDWYGILLDSSSGNGVTCNLVQNNGEVGFQLESGSTGNNITWNNIVANGELQTDGSYRYQFENSQSNAVDAINNFWGSGMNNRTIDASIHDDEEGHGKVRFYPFETDPISCDLTPAGPPVFTTADALIALQIAVGNREYDSHWDVNGDGKVTSLDALMIMKATVEAISQ
ncbi:MAG: right-handed parallel beta-helix repeat-containing protein [Euryarchaeota archaeon]|nr:right-handed parallel beta-helix repeat-containing protein [Euryarchaeota archaeon]